MFRLGANEEKKCCINFIIGVLLSTCALEAVGGILTLKGTGAYEDYSFPARIGFSSINFLIALACISSAGKLYCNTYGTPKLSIWDHSPDKNAENVALTHLPSLK